MALLCVSFPPRWPVWGRVCWVMTGRLWGVPRWQIICDRGRAVPLCSAFLQMPVGMRVSHMCSRAHPGVELSSDHAHGTSARPGSSQVTIPADPRDLTWGPLVSAPHFPPLCVGIWPRPLWAPCGTDGVARGKSGHWLWLVGKAPGAGQPSPWLGKREGGSPGLPVPAASAGLFGLTIVLWPSGRGEPVWSVPRRTICSARVKELGQMRRGPVPPEPPGTQGGCPSWQGLAGRMEGWACVTAMTDAPGRAPLLPQSCPARTVSVQEGGVTPVQEWTCRPPGCTGGFPWDTLQSSRCGRPTGPVFPDSTQQLWPRDGPSSQCGGPALEKFTPTSSLRPCERPCPRLVVAAGAGAPGSARARWGHRCEPSPGCQRAHLDCFCLAVMGPPAGGDKV